jgi:hypothetical protein
MSMVDGTTQDVLDRLDYLRDLFERRLLDDRDKRAMIEELREGPFRQYLHPFVRGIALVLDHLDRYDGADTRFVASIRDELLDLLADHGVIEVPVSGPFDPRRHEAVGTRADPGRAAGVIVEVRRRGLAHRDWVFRPAQVVVSEEPTP